MLKAHTRRSGSVAVLTLRGRVVRGETESLRQAVVAHSDASAVILDLAAVSIIEAGGLGLMLKLREHTKSRGIEFRLKNLTRRVKRIFEITRLDSVFDISHDGDDAKARVYHRWPLFRETVCCA